MKSIRYIPSSLITLFVIPLLLLHSCKPDPNTPPVASFKVAPGFGTTDTLFRYDASAVRDLEDPAEALKVRWDWDSDSIFDTEYSTEKVITHRFTEGGTFYTTVEVMDTRGAIHRYTDFVRVAWTNRAPKASFSISPQNGFLQDEFTFDGSSSSDPEDANASLRIRWDFESDGTWDTEYSVTKVVKRRYTTPGSYQVSLEVIDSGGLTGQATKSLNVEGTNLPPTVPGSPDPQHQSADRSTLCVLSWSCTDPESDRLLFDIHFGTSENPARVATGIEARTWQCPPLQYGITYFWKIVAKDPYNAEVSSPVWSFTTDTPVNDMGTFTDIRDNRVYKTVKILDKIWMAENLNVGTMIHASTGGENGDGYQRNNGRAEKFCYRNEPANCDLYGGLYQWDEALNYFYAEGATGICPPGWHLPTSAEWNELINYYKEQQIGPADALRLGSRSGFQALYSGYLIFAERKFYDINQAGYFWSSTPNPNINHLAMGRSLFVGNPDFKEDTFQKVSGLPVRCIKDY